MSKAKMPIQIVLREGNEKCRKKVKIKQKDCENLLFSKMDFGSMITA